MPTTVLVGTQWGDEGKGKIIDVLANNADMVVRYQGGNNAGHTVIVDNKKYILHLLPSGIHSQSTINVIGNGVVVNPVALLKEYDEQLVANGIDISSRFQISSRAHLVFKYHCTYDELSENAKSQDKKIGTTKRGIGPAYADKVNRMGIRTCDILHPKRFKEKFFANSQYYNKLFEAGGIQALDIEEEFGKSWVACQRIKPFITDTVLTINKAISQDKNILLEGAQGVWLDVDYGTYPYVTSSNPSASGATIGAGVAPRHINDVLGVAKAYTTRVGEGPFPTELYNGKDLNDKDGETMARIGNEFGATTGRPRRCGWFDAVATSYAVMLSGITRLAVTKLDVLDHLDEVKICTAYEIDGVQTPYMPVDLYDLENANPIYEVFSGWDKPTTAVKTFKDLPKNAQIFLNRLSELVKAPVDIISVGPNRDETFFI